MAHDFIFSNQVITPPESHIFTMEIGRKLLQNLLWTESVLCGQCSVVNCIVQCGILQDYIPRTALKYGFNVWEWQYFSQRHSLFIHSNSRVYTPAVVWCYCGREVLFKKMCLFVVYKFVLHGKQFLAIQIRGIE